MGSKGSPESWCPSGVFKVGEYTVQSRPSKVRSLKEHGLLGELGVITDDWKVRLVGDQTGKAERSGHDPLCHP